MERDKPSKACLLLWHWACRSFLRVLFSCSVLFGSPDLAQRSGATSCRQVWMLAWRKQAPQNTELILDILRSHKVTHM